MARVPYFDMSKAPPEFAALMAARRPLNLYRMLPHAGPAGQGFLKLGGALLRDNALEIGADTAALNELELKVLRFTDQLVHHVKAPDEMWNDLLKHLDHRQMAELVLTVGFYMMVSRFLENFEVDIETPGAAA